MLWRNVALKMTDGHLGRKCAARLGAPLACELRYSFSLLFLAVGVGLLYAKIENRHFLKLLFGAINIANFILR